jgi:hypothetical protein
MCFTVVNKVHSVGALLTSHCIFVALKSILMLLQATSFVRLWWQTVSMALQRKWVFNNKYNKVGVLWRSVHQWLVILLQKIVFIRDDIKHLFSCFTASNGEAVWEIESCYGRDHEYYCLLKVTSYLFAKRVEPEDGGWRFLRNSNKYLPKYTATH